MSARRAAGLILFIVGFLVIIGGIWEASLCNPASPISGLAQNNPCGGDDRWGLVLSKPSAVYEAYQMLSVAEKNDLVDRFWYTFSGGIQSVVYIALLTLGWLVIGAAVKPLLQGGYSLFWTLQVIPFLSYASVLGVIAGKLNAPMMDNILLGVIIGIFPMLAELLLGISKIPDDDVELLKVYRANFIDRLQILYFPKLAPSFFSGLYVAVPLAIVGVTLGDLSAGRHVGLGATVGSNISRNIDKVWMGTLGIMIISLAILAFVVLIELLFSRRYHWYRKYL